MDWVGSFLFGEPKMQPYPLVDPELLVSVLPNAPKRGGVPVETDPRYDPKYVDKFGYFKGVGGVRTTRVEWSRRPISQDHPYDVDLAVMISATPSLESASECFAEWLRTAAMLRGEALELPGSMAADHVDLQRVRWQGMPPVYLLTARYGNYVFRFIGEIAAGGYFEKEQEFFAHMQALGAHIRATLEQHAA